MQYRQTRCTIDQKMDLLKFKVNTGHFGTTTEEEKAQLIENHNAKNTNRAAKTSLRCLMNYLMKKERPALSEIANNELSGLLLDFYTDMRTKKTGDLYNIQTLKCMISNLNRHFKDITLI